MLADRADRLYIMMQLRIRQDTNRSRETHCGPVIVSVAFGCGLPAAESGEVPLSPEGSYSAIAGLLLTPPLRTPSAARSRAAKLRAGWGRGGDAP